MDPRTLASCSLLICCILATEVKSISFVKNDLPLPISTLGTDFSGKNPTAEISDNRSTRNYGKIAEDDSNEEDVEGAPPDHVAPYSEHENPEEPSTKPKYKYPGEWAKPSPEVPLDFVPTKLYAQVRETHSVKHLPREEALKSAATEEEKIAASRLREVISKSKSNTVYTEEGYEDAAYDHGGHVRDADFHEGYARKLENERKRKKNRLREKPEVEREEDDVKGVKEFNDYDDDYRDHAETSSRNAEEIERKNSQDPEEREKYRRIKGLWQDSSIDGKQITENEIEKLEDDLENEYEESQRNTETEVPKNLKSSDEKSDEKDGTSDEDSVKKPDYFRNNEDVVVPDKKSSEKSEDRYDEKIDLRKNEIRTTSLPRFEATRAQPVDTVEKLETRNIPEGSSTTANYGKIFWDYFKSVGHNWQPRESSTQTNILPTSERVDQLLPEQFTNLPNFASLQTTIGNLETSFDPPSTAFTNWYVTNRMDNPRPSPSSIYESWKRQDYYINPDESPEENFDSLDLYRHQPEENVDLGEVVEPEKDRFLNPQNDDRSTTTASPKKPPYTLIMRSVEKTTTHDPPCDCEDRTIESGERNLVKSSRYRHADVVKSIKDRLSPTLMNDFTAENDLIAIRPPLPVPLGQVTFSDYSIDSYAGPARPSVTPQFQPGEEVRKDEREWYEGPKNPYNEREREPESEEIPPVLRQHRRPIPLPGRKRHYHDLPHLSMMKLRPPSPINRSKYANYVDTKRRPRPRTRPNGGLTLTPWPDIVRFYRSIDRTIFGRRKRRSIVENHRENGGSNEKVDARVDASRGKKLRPKRDLLREEADRFVLTGNSRLVKSKGRETSKGRGDDNLLRESPRIVDDVIDAEIETRFKDENAEEIEDDEKRSKIEIEVPDFDFSEEIRNDPSQKIINNKTIEEQSLDNDKYPFYENPKVPRSSALKYITNPRKVPRKTLGGTEFYDSRDKYRECDEVEPDIESEVLPEEEQPSAEREQRGDRPRLHGLGDKLDCFRAKYFDDDPLDNPLFREKQVGQPLVPEELDPGKFASRIFNIRDDEDHRVARRISRKPEAIGLDRSESRRNRLSQGDNQGQSSRIEDEERRRKISRKNHSQEFLDRRRKRKKPPQPTTPAPELATTPYQDEVYEDVMGTIKNLAGLYQTFGEPVPSSSSNRPIADHSLEASREKYFDRPVIHITERPRGFMTRHLPPRRVPNDSNLQHYRKIPYRTNKVSYRMRTRNETPPGQQNVKVGYFKTVTVHKRSIDDEGTSDLKVDESRNTAASRIKRIPPAIKGPDRTRKSDGRMAASERIVYTIRDRIKHSKPRGIVGRYGKFSNLETAATEDIRRREPRYNVIRRKKLPSSGNTPIVTTSRWKEPEEEPEETGTSAENVTLKDPTSGRQDYYNEPDEMYKIQFSTITGKQVDPSKLEEEDEEEPSSSEDNEQGIQVDDGSGREKQRSNSYDVHENLEEDVMKISSLNDEPTKAPEFSKLQKYLQSDPPGYSEAFNEGSSESTSRYPEEGEPMEYKGAETKRELEEDAEDEEADDEDNDGEEGQIEKPSGSYADEESSARSEEAEDSSDSPKQLESYKNPEEDDEEAEEEHSPQVEETTPHFEDSEKEFDRFAYRPFSPYESYEDSKYSHLGPRLNKPAFYHPSFSESSSGRYRDKKTSEEGDESDEESEEKSRYIFPWEADEEDDAEESKDEVHKVGRYEYPWERRERLAKIRRKKAKERKKYEKLFSFFDDDDEAEEDDEEASSTKSRQKRIYPWERYKTPSKKTTKASRRIVDNEEMSSDYRPRFSSRYKSKIVDSKNVDDAKVVKSDDPRKKVNSATKSSEKASENESKSGNQSTTTTEPTIIPTSSPPVFTVASKRLRNIPSRLPVIGTTPTTTTTRSPSRRARIWRTSSSTTMKPKSGSTTPSAIRGRTRQRGPVRPGSSTTTTTTRPIRRRFQKTTPATLNDEDTTLKSVNEKSTTPKVKTVEHRSRFSKEEIITKTSYPGLNNDENIEKVNGNNDRGRKDSSEATVRDDGSRKVTSESVKKVSITTKETPDHIYRTEEIDKNGVKGMFVSIMPNNGTNSSSYDIGSHQGDGRQSMEMLKNLHDIPEIDDDEKEEEDEDGEISFMRDSHLLVNLLRQVPPYTNDLTHDESSTGNYEFSYPEGSGSAEIEDDFDDEDPRNEIRTNYVKNPNDRLYYYVEKRK